jgi:hypothetical protein
MFLLSPTPLAFTSARMSRASSGTTAASEKMRLQAKASARVLREQPGRFLLAGLGQLVDREEVEACGIGGFEQLQRRVRQVDTFVGQLGHLERVLARQAGESGPVGVQAQQRLRGRVVDAGCHRYVVGQRRALRLVLRAGGGLHLRGGADEANARFFQRAHELRVFGHEAVAGEDAVVAVPLADGDHLVDAVLALFLGGARVVGDVVDVARVDDAQLGGQRARVDDAVALREQDADALDAHLAEDLDGLLAHGAAAHDQHAHVFAGKAAHPAAAFAGESAVGVDQRVLFVGVAVRAHQWNSRCTPVIGPGM